MELDLRHLRLLVTIADAGSLSAAANRLDQRQPTVSTQLRRIENALGGPLFERSASGARPTPRGESVLRRARVVLAQVDVVSGLLEASVPTVRVRSCFVSFEAILPPLLRLAPGVRWDVTASAVTDGIAAVARGDADLYVGLWWGDRTLPLGLVVDEIVREQSWIMFPAGHERADGPVSTLRSLAGEHFVSRSDPDLHRALVEDCQRAGFTPRVQVRAADERGVLSAVGSGTGVALTSPLAERDATVVMQPCRDARSQSWAQVHRPGTLPADLIRLLAELSRWAYAFRARSNAQLCATLPADLLDAPFPAPLRSAHLDI